MVWQRDEKVCRKRRAKILLFRRDEKCSVASFVRGWGEVDGKW